MSAPDFLPSVEGRWIEFAPGKRRILLHTSEIMQVKSEIDAGLTTPMHSHSQTQISYVLSGRITVTVGDNTAELSAGDSFIVPPDVTHGASAMTKVVLLDTFAPARPDFL